MAKYRKLNDEIKEWEEQMKVYKLNAKNEQEKK